MEKFVSSYFFSIVHYIYMRSKFTVEFEKRFGNKIPDRKIPTLAKYFKIKKSLIQDAFNRGVGAYKGNPSSIRPSVKVQSNGQWLAVINLY